MFTAPVTDVASSPKIEDDIRYFLTVALPSIVESSSIVEGRRVKIYYGGVHRPEDINYYEYYDDHGTNMPVMNPIICMF
jgi:hypothetical protein